MANLIEIANNAVAQLNEDQEALRMVLKAAIRDLERCNKQIRENALRLQEEMARVVSDIDAQNTVNSLGVVQSKGTDLDKLAKEQHTRIGHLEALLHVAESTQ